MTMVLQNSMLWKMNQDYTKIIIRDLTLQMSIGIYEHEKQSPQRVFVNIDAFIEPFNSMNDDIRNTVSYEEIINVINKIALEKHYNLAESFAEEIADTLIKDKKIKKLQVRVEKPDIIERAKRVGVEILKSNL